MINLVLAGVWLGVAVMAFLQTGGQEWVIPNTSIEIRWLALALFVYNLVRYGMSQAYRRRAAAPPLPEPPRHQPTDSQFDFSDPRPGDPRRGNGKD